MGARRRASVGPDADAVALRFPVEDALARLYPRPLGLGLRDVGDDRALGEDVATVGLIERRIRIGTPCVTTRGFGDHGLEAVGEGIIRMLNAPEDEAVLGEVVDDIVRLCEEYPVYP